MPWPVTGIIGLAKADPDHLVDALMSPDVRPSLPVAVCRFVRDGQLDRVLSRHIMLSQGLFLGSERNLGFLFFEASRLPDGWLQVRLTSVDSILNQHTRVCLCNVLNQFPTWHLAKI